MTHIYYPTTEQLTLAVRWANRGAAVIEPENATGRRDHDRVKSENLIRIRDLIFRLELPWQYETMRREILYRSARSIDPRLIEQITATLRAYGYVFWLSPGVLSVTPLTAHQLRIVRMLAAGSTYADVASALGCDRGTLYKTLHRVRGEHGARTTEQLVAKVYAAGWLPTFAEHAALRRSAVHPEGKPFRRASALETELSA